MKRLRDEVHVWLTRPEQARGEELLRGYAALMTPDEREKQQRYYFERDRHACLVTRALVRTTLSRYGSRAPAEWRFEKNEHGCPRLVPEQRDPELRFNLSHTRGLIACAVTLERAVGVDVEHTGRAGETVAIADRYFSADEVGELRSLPESRQRDRFFDYWTLKESYIKARGMGLALPLSRFTFLLGETAEDGPVVRGIGIRFDPRLADDPSGWQFELRRSYGEQRLALAVRKGDGEALGVRVREVVPAIRSR
jgi:4'-phosphopantetheinyl transferase